MKCESCRKKKVDLKCSCGKVLVYGGKVPCSKVTICKHCGMRHDKEIISVYIKTGVEKIL